MESNHKSEKREKDREKWEQEAAKQYSRIIETAKHVLETKLHIRSVYAEIKETLAHIQKSLKADPKQGQQVVKLKRHFWNRTEADTFSGHMDKVGGKLEHKFVNDTEMLCGRTARTCIEFDFQMLGEFLERHGIKARKLNHEARAARYEEIIEQDTEKRPIFFNIRRNLLAIVAELKRTA